MKEWFNKIKNSDSVSRIYAFLVAIVWAFGVVGGAGYLFWIREPQFAVAEILVGLMALPYVIKQYEKLLG